MASWDRWQRRTELERNTKTRPLELGFNYSYIMAATQDRVPCVYIDGHQVENLDPADPITVNYKGPIPNANIPTYKEHPELLEMTSSNGHNNSVINGIGRIGYMSGENCNMG